MASARSADRADAALDGVRGSMIASIASMNYHWSDDRLAPRTQMLGVRIGALEVMNYRGFGKHWAERRRQHIIDDASDKFVVCIPSNARCGLRQAGFQKDYKPGSLVFVSMQNPFQAYISGEGESGAFSAICVRVPGPLLRQRFPEIDDLCNHAVPITPGVSHIMRSMLELTLLDGPYLQHEDGEVLCATLLDLMANAARQACARELIDVNRRSSLERVIAQASAFIHARLSDPNLDSAMVAAHCRVSTRYLHTAFSARHGSVASYIRETRLQRCRDALLTESLQRHSITELASRWGFADSSSFSRAYKRRFGVAPARERFGPR